MSPVTKTTVAPARAEVIPEEAVLAALAADQKLGEDTVILFMGELLGVIDAFVITTGRNDRHVRALVEEVELRLKERDGTAPIAIEGLLDATWVLMDYGDFVVHVFDEHTRRYFDLEHLWSSAPRHSWLGAEDERASGVRANYAEQLKVELAPR